ncbi:predicted protein [Botrytis cinerea T4]|uniref:Uncharacterized protein n=1 Tax=Botryotinia fuckeliana (strain T4) TaxID=999810 RepID=G2XVI6_BOTF4|nr:predicted protein [Botrytis cinerea T4]
MNTVTAVRVTLEVKSITDELSITFLESLWVDSDSEMKRWGDIDRVCQDYALHYGG